MTSEGKEPGPAREIICTPSQTGDARQQKSLRHQDSPGITVTVLKQLGEFKVRRDEMRPGYIPEHAVWLHRPELGLRSKVHPLSAGITCIGVGESTEVNSPR